MQKFFSFFLVSLSVLVLIGFAADTGPEKLVFKTKMKDVVFNHADHVTRAKGDCKVCHDKLWPQSAKAPLNYAAAMHKAAEKSRTSCAFCHVAGGSAFASVGNCNKCHGNK
jgi:c(7)-type cytochrome triheme protein